MGIIAETEKLVCETCKGIFDNLEKIKIEYNKHQMSEERQIEFTQEINNILDKYNVKKKDKLMVFALSVKLTLSLLEN